MSLEPLSPIGCTHCAIVVGDVSMVSTLARIVSEVFNSWFNSCGSCLYSCGRKCSLLQCWFLYFKPWFLYLNLYVLCFTWWSINHNLWLLYIVCFSETAVTTIKQRNRHNNCFYNPTIVATLAASSKQLPRRLGTRNPKPQTLNPKPQTLKLVLKVWGSWV